MKTILSMVTVYLLAGLNLFAADGMWLTDFEKAKTQAKKQEVPILAEFAGSDWCGWCIKLEKEVLSKDAFKEYAKENLVLFLADFPRSKEQPEALQEQNQTLAQRYGVRGFPAVLLLDENGKEIARTGYRPGGAQEYIEHLKEISHAGSE